MYRRTLFLACSLILACAAHAQWQFAGPGLLYPASVAQNSDYVFFAATRGSGASADGGYVYRSANGGRTWTSVSAGLRSSQKPLGPNITAVGATDGLVVVAARQAYNVAHLYFSTNNGATWTLRTNFPAVYEGGIRQFYVLNADTIVAYASVTSSQYRVIVSTDGGTTWTTQPEVFGTQATMPVADADGVLYLPGSNQFGGRGVRVSEDLGATWTDRFRQGPTNVIVDDLFTWADGTRVYQSDYVTGGGTSQRVMYWTDDRGLTWQTKLIPGLVELLNTNRLDAITSKGNTIVAKSLVTQRPRPGGGGVESFNDDVMAYSTDLGDTWSVGDPDSTLLRAQYNRNISNLDLPLGIVATKTGFLYANVTASTFGNRLYYSADGIDWDAVNVNGFVRDIGNVVPFGDALLAFEDETIGGGAGFFRSDDGASWRYVTKLNYGFNEAEGCAQGHGLGLAVALNGKVVAVCETDVYHSTDGLNFTKVGVNTVPTGRTKMLVEDGGTLYLLSWSSSLSGYGGQNVVLYTSTDEGLTWAQGASGMRTLDRPSVAGGRIIFSDRSKAYVSTDNGATFGEHTGLFGSTDAGVAATPTALFAGSGFERLFFGTYLNKKTFFRSTDGGQTWQDLIAEGVIADGPRSLHADGKLLIGVFTDSVAVSQDDGATWYGMADGWPTGVRGEDAFVHNDTLYVQVLFEGLYYAPLADLGLVVAAEREERFSTALRVWPSPARGDVQVRYTLTQAQRIEVAVYDLLGRKVATLDDGFAPSGTHTATWHESGLAAGMYIVRLTTEGGHSESKAVVRM